MITRRVLWRLALRPALPPPILQLVLQARDRLQPHRHRFDRLTLLNAAFARETSVRERLAQHQRRTPADPRAAQAEGLRSGLLPYALELTHHIAAARLIEPRYPFLDRSVIDFCLSLPPEQSLHDGWDRVVMRRAMAGILPPTVQWRTSKSRLGSNFLRQLWHRDQGRIKVVVRDDRGVLAPFVDPRALDDCYRRYLTNPLGRPDEAQVLYGMVQLATWLATF